MVKGKNINVEYNAYNTGHVSTTATIRFYLSSNNVISSGDRFIGTRVINLNANSFVNTTTWLNIPTSVPTGNYYVGWTMSASSSTYPSGRHWAVIGSEKLTVNNPPADLITINPAVSKSVLLPGEVFTASATVKNQGGVSSVSSLLRYYRSNNSIISTGDIQIGSDFVTGLSPNGTSFESAPVVAPAAKGLYWIGACVDSVAGESPTNNQCSTGVAINVGIPPDKIGTYRAATATWVSG